MRLNPQDSHPFLGSFCSSHARMDLRLQYHPV
uniref:Uncharacterized protein n=1 Tax=Arundo donax TaxID=35708 RepID=A0A0A9ALK9_ARUDO